MKFTRLTQRLSNLGGAKWDIHFRARTLAAQGNDIIEMTIGEPDISAPPELIEAAVKSMRIGRTNYADARGEPNLRSALAEKYSISSGREISPAQVLCFPGTQTALFAVMMGIAEAGNDVLVGDPMYATYEGVIRSTGADMVQVPLLPQDGFRIQAFDIAERITPRSSAVLLTSPHNPSGAILTKHEIQQIGELAVHHDLWIVCDEVYEDLVFDGGTFFSPLWIHDLADRTIIVSSISKSHAVPGFRSGWCIAPAEFIDRLLPLVESMLFGNQPFIADMTEAAIKQGSSVAEGMRERFARRAALLSEYIGSDCGLTVHPPQAGMFALINVSGTGADGYEFASGLLEKEGVAVMPGSSFGSNLQDWIRISLTLEDDVFLEGCRRLKKYAESLL
ncbi:MAG: pyridoxal phosphate-dependent aminotransferase [Pseudomonadota bacterium]